MGFVMNPQSVEVHITVTGNVVVFDAKTEERLFVGSLLRVIGWLTETASYVVETKWP